LTPTPKFHRDDLLTFEDSDRKSWYLLLVVDTVSEDAPTAGRFSRDLYEWSRPARVVLSRLKDLWQIRLDGDAKVLWDAQPDPVGKWSSFPGHRDKCLCPLCCLAKVEQFKRRDQGLLEAEEVRSGAWGRMIESLGVLDPLKNVR
jgi:hypothetical protein